MKNHLIINGSGEYPGGTYDKISIRGEGTIVNPVECSVFHVYGTSEVADNLTTGSAKILGETEVKGNVNAEEILIMGTMSVGGKAYLKKMKVYGLLEVGDRLNGNDATIKGSISAKGDVEFETFTSSGGFEIEGLLNAETIKIALRFGESKAEEIGGGKITVKRRRNSLLSFKGDAGSLVAKVIEGDDIYLENTKAEIVRGNKVQIGPGCQIELVEYAGELKENASSIIKNTKKI